MWHRALYVKTYVRSIAAGDVNLPQQHYCATLNIFTYFTVKTNTECIAALPTQQKLGLRERATVLTFSSLAVTLRTARFNIKKFYVVPTLRLCVLYRSQNKQQLLPYKTLRDWFL
jgi:hypothetical protein